MLSVNSLSDPVLVSHISQNNPDSPTLISYVSQNDPDIIVLCGDYDLHNYKDFTELFNHIYSMYDMY